MNKYFQAPWTIKDILASLAISIVALLAIGLIIKNWEIVKTFGESSSRTYLIIGTLILQWFIILAPIGLITKKKYGINKKIFGLHNIGIFNTIKSVIGNYFIFLIISLIISIFIIYTGIKIPGYQIQEKILPMFSGDTLSLVIAGIFIVIIGPIIEEIYFRGIILRTLTNKVGIFLGSTMSALMFAVFHMQWQNIIPIFILGLIINAIVIRNKSIVPAIFFHAFNNLIAFGIEILLITNKIKIDDFI